MSKTHWKKLVNPNYLGAYSIEDGKDLILKIKAVRVEDIIGEAGRKDQGMVAHFHDSPKPMILNKTNAKTVQKVVGSPYIEDWADHSIALYATTTRFGGDTVECLRIRPFAPKQTGTEQIACSECGAFITAYGKMTPAQLAEHTRKKYGKALCSDCAKAAAEQSAKPDKVTEQINQQQTATEQQEESNG